MKKIHLFSLLFAIVFVLACSKEKNIEALSMLEVIGVYQITDTYVYRCPGETDNLTLYYSYQVHVGSDGNTLIAANINEVNTSVYQGSINGNSFSIVANSGVCGLFGQKENGNMKYTIGCINGNFETDAQEECGGFIIQPIFPSNLVSRTTNIIKTS